MDGNGLYVCIYVIAMQGCGKLTNFAELLTSPLVNDHKQPHAEKIVALIRSENKPQKLICIVELP